MRRLGYEESARLFRLAIDVGGGELDEISRCRLLLATARALFRSGEIAACVDTCVEAATRAARIGRADLMAQAALVPETVGPSETEATTRRLCADALAVVDPDEIAVRARLTARLAEASIYVAWGREHGTEDYVVAGSASEQALELAERSGDRAALEAALRARRLACSGPDGIDERRGLAERMLSLGRATADPVTRMWSHLWSIDVAFEFGDLTRVGREVESLSWCAGETRGPIARFHLLTSQAVLAQARGRFADAIRLMHEAFGAVAWTGENSHGFTVRAGLLGLVGHHIGHEASGSVEAIGYGDATVFDRPLPTAGVIVAVAQRAPARRCRPTRRSRSGVPIARTRRGMDALTARDPGGTCVRHRPRDGGRFARRRRAVARSAGGLPRPSPRQRRRSGRVRRSGRAVPGTRRSIPEPAR